MYVFVPSFLGIAAPAVAGSRVHKPAIETRLDAIQPIDLRSHREQHGQHRTIESVRFGFMSEANLALWVRYFGDLRTSLLLTPLDDTLRWERMAIWSAGNVSPDAAWMGFLAALELYGYSLTFTGEVGVIARTSAWVRLDAPMVELYPLEPCMLGDILPLLHSDGTELMVDPKEETLIISGPTEAVLEVHYQIEALLFP